MAGAPTAHGQPRVSTSTDSRCGGVSRREGWFFSGSNDPSSPDASLGAPRPAFGEPMTDAELVARVVAGDAGAFTDLVARYHAACLRYAAHVLGNRMEAEDVVQETLLRAYRSLGRYRERQQFRPWLFRILINRCRSAMSRRGVRRLRTAEPLDPDTVATRDGSAA